MFYSGYVMCFAHALRASQETPAIADCVNVHNSCWASIWRRWNELSPRIFLVTTELLSFLRTYASTESKIRLKSYQQDLEVLMEVVLVMVYEAVTIRRRSPNQPIVKAQVLSFFLYFECEKYYYLLFQ